MLENNKKLFQLFYYLPCDIALIYTATMQCYQCIFYRNTYQIRVQTYLEIITVAFISLIDESKVTKIS